MSTMLQAVKSSAPSPSAAPEATGQLPKYLPTLKVLSFYGPGESGDVSISLTPLVMRLGTKIHWFALTGVPDCNSNNGSQAFSYHTPKVTPPVLEHHAQASYGYLWPLFHGMRQRAIFDAESWRGFRQLNEIMASECLNVYSGSFPTLCWLHDYQLALTAPMLSIEAGLILSHFWHIPWPRPEVIKDSPVIREILEGLLTNRVIGFHTSEYAINFLNTVSEVLPSVSIDILKMEVRHNQSLTKVVVMPLGIDFAFWQKLANASKCIALNIPIKNSLAKHSLADRIVLGVDRLDYTKGIYEKLLGLEKFLTLQAGWHQRFHFVQIMQPAQSKEQQFVEYRKLVESKTKEINEKFGSKGWQPVISIEERLEQSELAAWYQAAHIMVVNSVRDGLNLVAKEYVACRQDEQGVLMLSKNAGCSAEFAQGALLTDPVDPDQFAKTLEYALCMDEEEKRRRMGLMRSRISFNQLHDWALSFLQQALTISIN